MKPENIVDVLFGNRLRRLLDAKNISQAHFADRIGVSRSRMNNYITQRSEPDYATLIRIANDLDTTIDFLLGKSEHQGLPQTSNMGSMPTFQPNKGTLTNMDPDHWIPLYKLQFTIPEEQNAPQPIGWIHYESPQAASNYRRCYAILVNDDSMKPYLLPGDIAYIQPMVIFHNCLSGYPANDIYSVRLHENDTIGVSLKKCYSRDNLLVFFCENSLYSPHILNMTQIRFSPITGKVMYIWRFCNGSGISDFIDQLSIEDEE